MAADASGNIYVADSTTNLVQQIPPGCTSSGCLKTLGGGFNRPQGVAIDGAGNVYVADHGNSAFKEIPASCIAGANDSTCVSHWAAASANPEGVAVDAGGNVYVADTRNNAVEEMTPGCANSGCVTALGGNYSFSGPGGVALDASGNVYVADSHNGIVEEMTRELRHVRVRHRSRRTPGQQRIHASGGRCRGHEREHLCFADFTAVRVMPAGCGTSSCVSSAGSYFGLFTAVAVDQRGDILLAESAGQAIQEMDYADPPNLSFDHD